MFENVGEKIKGFAQFIFWLEVILAIVFAFIYVNDTGSDFWIFFVIVGAAFVIGYLSVIMLVAFGELVENTYYIRKILERMDTKEGTSLLFPRKEAEVNKIQNNTISTPNTPKPDFWICPQCGRENHKTVGTCGCGQEKV